MQKRENCMYCRVLLQQQWHEEYFKSSKIYIKRETDNRDNNKKITTIINYYANYQRVLHYCVYTQYNMYTCAAFMQFVFALNDFLLVCFSAVILLLLLLLWLSRVGIESMYTMEISFPVFENVNFLPFPVCTVCALSKYYSTTNIP